MNARRTDWRASLTLALVQLLVLATASVAFAQTAVIPGCRRVPMLCLRPVIAWAGEPTPTAPYFDLDAYQPSRAILNRRPGFGRSCPMD